MRFVTRNINLPIDFGKGSILNVGVSLITSYFVLSFWSSFPVRRNRSLCHTAEDNNNSETECVQFSNRDMVIQRMYRCYHPKRKKN